MRNALHHAARIGSFEMVEFLVEAGANLNCLDAYGQLPSQLASIDTIRAYLLEAMEDKIRVPYVVEMQELLFFGAGTNGQHGAGDTKDKYVPTPVDYFKRTKVAAVETGEVRLWRVVRGKGGGRGCLF